MNNKGFTLIELLAVIVILSSLVLLVGTSVTKIVKTSKEDISDIQVKLIESATKNLVSDNINGLPGIGKCSYLTVSDLKEFGYLDSDSNENLNDDLKIKITTTRNSKTGKLITNYEVDVERIDGCYKHIYRNGDVVYFDVIEGEGCTSNDYKSANSDADYKGINPNGNQNNCLKFYAFNDNGGNTLNLLLDHNTTSSVSWNSTASTNASGPRDVLTELKSNTSSWEGTLTPSDYVYNGDNATYTIEYYDYNARLITAQEIAEITGAVKVLNWNERVSTNGYYFHSLNLDAETGYGSVCKPNCEYGWIYDRTFKDCTQNGCFNNSTISSGTHLANQSGYWTSSSLSSSKIEAWAVYSIGGINKGSISIEYAERGVRPVIEVLKSKLK